MTFHLHPEFEASMWDHLDGALAVPEGDLSAAEMVSLAEAAQAYCGCPLDA